jgi:hypothetical protein
MLKLLNQEMSQQLQQNLALQATLAEEDQEVEEAEEAVVLQEALNLLQEVRDPREDVALQEVREPKEALQEVEDLPSDQELKEAKSLLLLHRSNQSHQSKKKRDHHPRPPSLLPTFHSRWMTINLPRYSRMPALPTSLLTL